MSGNELMSEAEESAVEPEQADGANDVVQPGRAGRGPALLAGLALLVALCASAFSIWLWREHAMPADGLVELTARMDEQKHGLDETVGRLDGLDSRLSGLDDRGSQASRQLDQQQDRVEQALATMAGIEEQMERLETRWQAQVHELSQQAGRERESDLELQRQLGMIEAASLLRFGQDRAELATDLPSARMAFQRASSLLRQLDDPRLGQVQRLLARELEALQATDMPDWLAVQVRLQRLSRSSLEWPLARPANGASGEAAVEVEQAEGWRASVRNALGQLVRVQPRDSRVFSEDQLDSLREQLQLRLLAAELAVTRQSLAELDHHLEQAGGLLKTYFDISSEAVSKALEQLEDLRDLQAPALPSGLGQALSALQDQLEQP
jgi:uroporphyrin-III C-methyltransferase